MPATDVASVGASEIARPSAPGYKIGQIGWALEAQLVLKQGSKEYITPVSFYPHGVAAHVRRNRKGRKGRKGRGRQARFRALGFGLWALGFGNGCDEKGRALC